MWSSKRQRISDPSNSSEGNTKKKKKRLINKSQQKHRDERREVRVHLVPNGEETLSRDWVKNIFKTWENERKGQCSK